MAHVQTKCWLLKLATAACATLAASPANATTEQVLASFLGKQGGDTPAAGVIEDAQGNLYGTTEQDLYNDRGFGTIYEVQGRGESAKLTTLWNFGQNKGDGKTPTAPLIADSKGVLYGTTVGGGVLQEYGTVFTLTPPAKNGQPWTESIIYSFQVGDDVANPIGGLTFGPNGVLYGTATSPASGGVFMLSPPVNGGTTWTETTLYTFQPGSDGAHPLGSLISDASGALYGVTYEGGTAGYGTVYKLTPPAQGQTTWTETVLYSFLGYPDGAYPNCTLAMDSAGNLYGTANQRGLMGGGILFELSPPAGGNGPWQEIPLYNFQADGFGPIGSTILQPDGSVLTATEYGGTNNNGAVAKLIPANGSAAWTEQIVYAFDYSYHHRDGIQPVSIIVDGTGNIYGATAKGGKRGKGTIFEVSP
jgi:uncharacterized repeat protein (TIGR03803 family)